MRTPSARARLGGTQSRLAVSCHRRGACRRWWCSRRRQRHWQQPQVREGWQPGAGALRAARANQTGAKRWLGKVYGRGRRVMVASRTVGREMPMVVARGMTVAVGIGMTEMVARETTVAVARGMTEMVARGMAVAVAVPVRTRRAVAVRTMVVGRGREVVVRTEPAAEGGMAAAERRMMAPVERLAGAGRNAAARASSAAPVAVAAEGPWGGMALRAESAPDAVLPCAVNRRTCGSLATTAAAAAPVPAAPAAPAPVLEAAAAAAVRAAVLRTGSVRIERPRDAHQTGATWRRAQRSPIAGGECVRGLVVTTLESGRATLCTPPPPAH